MADVKSTPYPELKLNTGAMMPQLGFGTFLSSPGEVGPAVKAALLAGYKHIDCAAVYGNEKEIGVVFAELFNDKDSGIKREDIFITSKLWVAQARPDTVEAMLKKTLADLQLEYLDLYLIHQPIIIEPNPDYDQKHRIIGKFRPLRGQGWGLQDIYRGMETCYNKGLTKAIGISNFNAQTFNDCLMYAKVPPAVNQIERHPYLAQPAMVSFAKTTMSWSPPTHRSAHLDSMAVLWMCLCWLTLPSKRLQPSTRRPMLRSAFAGPLILVPS